MSRINFKLNCVEHGKRCLTNFPEFCKRLDGYGDVDVTSYKHVPVKKTPLHPPFYKVKLGFTGVYIF